MTRDCTPINADVPVAAPDEFRPLELGALRVWPPVVLAPMAGVTNYPFRRICREYGAGVYVSEMITARGYLEGNAMTRLLASGDASENPRSVQLYGAVPEEVERAARLMVDDGVQHVDLNFGCPVPKVTRHGGGSAIPVKPRLMARIVAAAVRGAAGLPVTVKVRKGIDDDLLTYGDAGRVAQEEGAAAIGLHARTAAQLYSGEADWHAIADLKRRVRIPVLGNGDVWEAWDALRMMRETGCDGVIIGRGCLRRPWMFGELAAVFDGREPPPQPCFGAIADLMRRHAEALVAFFGPRNGIHQMRKWCAWYTTGFAGGAQARAALATIDSVDAMMQIIARIDPAAPFPTRTVRSNRVKDSHVQRRVALPEHYLDDREDASSPVEPADAWRAVDGG